MAPGVPLEAHKRHRVDKRMRQCLLAVCMLMTTLAALFVVFCVCLFLLHRFCTTSAHTFPLPPGPSPLPLIGNMLQVPTEAQWLTYSKWASIWGDIMHIKVLGQSIVIVSSVEAAYELFEKHSSTVSSRYLTPMMDLSGFGWSLAALPYGDAWKERRRKFHQYFRESAIQDYFPLQSMQCLGYLRDLHTHPEGFWDLTKKHFGRSILQTVYGFEDETTLDHFIALTQRVLEAAFAVTIPGKWWIDFLPWLKDIPSWVPGATFKKHAASFRNSVLAAFDEPFQKVRLIKYENKPQSFISIVPRALDTFENDEILLRDAAAVAYIAGFDTVTSAMLTFFLAMTLHPEIQRRAQRELDEIVGSGRSPEFGDRDSLPYITAIIKECLRWQPVSPLGLPHQTTAEDVYKSQYFIPKGSLVIGNIWAIMHDPKAYPCPDEFDPGRFLTPDGQLSTDVRDPELTVFGFGRRICPGRHFALNVLFIHIASVLHVYDISPSLDEFGQEILPKVQMTPDFISQPEEFSCTVKPRLASIEALIRGDTLH